MRHWGKGKRCTCALLWGTDGVCFVLFLSQSVFNRIRCEVLLHMWSLSLSSHLSYSLMIQCDMNDLLNQSGLNFLLFLSPVILSSSFLTVSTCQGNFLVCLIFIQPLFLSLLGHLTYDLYELHTNVQRKHFQYWNWNQVFFHCSQQSTCVSSVMSYSQILRLLSWAIFTCTKCLNKI